MPKIFRALTFLRNNISLCLVFNHASSFIPFYNDYIFIVYFTLRSAFNTISAEREKLKQLMEQDVSSPSAQVVGLKRALSSVSATSVHGDTGPRVLAHESSVLPISTLLLQIHEKTKQVI